MGYLSIIFKGLISLVVLFLISKLMGRKQVGQLNLFDYIIGISIGSIAAEMMLNHEVDFIEGVIAIFTYGFLSYFITMLTMKSIKARRFFTGSPTILIENGNILYKNLKKSKLDINGILQEARINGYYDLSQVEYAILESSGKISFLLKSKYQSPTRNDLKLKTSYEGLCCNALMDGKIMINNLKQIGKDEKWLLTRLKNNHYENIEDLILVIIDSKEKMTVFQKNDTLHEIKILE